MKLKEDVVRGAKTYVVVAVKGEEFIAYRWDNIMKCAKFALSENAMKVELGVSISTTGKGLTLSCRKDQWGAATALFEKYAYEVDVEAMQLIAEKLAKAEDEEEEEDS